MTWQIFWWTTADDQAAATLIAGVLAFVAGLAAVIGAIVVGLRQAAILRAQADLSGKAIEIEIMKTRIDLFERRMKVYEGTRAFVRAIVTTGRMPGMNEKLTDDADRKSHEVMQDFVDAMNASRFLFEPSIYAKLDALWERAAEMESHQSESGDGQSSQAARQIARKSAAELRKIFTAQFSNLPELFGEELRLYHLGEAHLR